MSRSRLKTPIVGWGGNNSCKAWRTSENRRYRCYVRGEMVHERYDDIQAFEGGFGNEWDSPRDGKGWSVWGKDKPCGEHKSLFGYYVWKCCPETGEHYGCHVSYTQQMRK